MKLYAIVLFAVFAVRKLKKKLVTEEHTFDGALQIALGAEAAEKDVAGFSQNAATPVNKLDSGNRQTFRPHKPRKPPGKGQGNKPSSQHNNNGTSECLSCGKSGRMEHITDACKSKPQKVHNV